MSTPETPGNEPTLPVVDAELVAGLARQFWDAFTGDATAVQPIAPLAAQSLPAFAKTAPLEQSTATALESCGSIEDFAVEDPLVALGHSVDVGDLITAPGSTFVAGHPGDLLPSSPPLGLPGVVRDGGQVPYYLQERLVAAPPPLDAATQLDPIVTASEPATTHQPGSVPPNPFASVTPSLPDPRGGPAVSSVTPGLSPQLVSGVASASLPGSLASARNDFPILREIVNGRQIVWLDNAATTQKPQVVIDRLRQFYEHENSNIHRAAHTLAARSTDAYEGARGTVARFINAGSPENIVFVRGATEAINLVAQAWGRKYVRAGDEIVISWLEHHSNIVPWQQLATETGARLVVVPVDSRGQILLHEYERLLGPRTKLVSLTHVSNALGTVLPVEEMVASAHRYGAKVLVDGAQSISHMPVDVRRIDADFFALSGHKVFAPTGIGALYGKTEVLEAMPPWQGGGNMIADVTFERTVYMPPPARFEAGTGNIADAIGLGAALEYLERIGMANVAAHEHDLIDYATTELLKIPGVRIIGTAAAKAGVVSFVLANRSVPDVGAALAAAGVAVRAGHHCAQPALRRFGLEATVRPSFALYNNHEDIDALTSVVKDLAQGPAR